MDSNRLVILKVSQNCVLSTDSRPVVEIATTIITTILPPSPLAPPPYFLWATTIHRTSLGSASPLVRNIKQAVDSATGTEEVVADATETAEETTTEGRQLTRSNLVIQYVIEDKRWIVMDTKCDDDLCAN